ncbi:MAG: ribosome silencing factor [Deltaproteobacteria bacterium HGW-Deltaproteobacteria-8]|jgi:ribosome-associated protein|nr:MAG: ribosome silencing factor [Deltaproteobacteria bacterium HGW-Deltaproteobacteria-8]
MKKNQQLPRTPGVPTEEKGLLLARTLDEKQGEEIVLLDVAGVCPIAEQIIMVTAKGQRHAQALADALLHLAKERNIASLGLEGYQTGTWVLLDFNDIIVHIFQEELRGFYNIEGLWSEGRRVNWSTVSQDAE